FDLDENGLHVLTGDVDGASAWSRSDRRKSTGRLLWHRPQQERRHFIAKPGDPGAEIVAVAVATTAAAQAAVSDRKALHHAAAGDRRLTRRRDPDGRRVGTLRSPARTLWPLRDRLRGHLGSRLRH